MLEFLASGRQSKGGEGEDDDEEGDWLLCCAEYIDIMALFGFVIIVIIICFLLFTVFLVMRGRYAVCGEARWRGLERDRLQRTQLSLSLTVM